MKMKSKSTQVLFHVIGCTIFLLLPIIFWPGEGGIGEFFSDDRAVRGYLNNILILIFFYLIYYLLIPELYFQKKYFYFIGILFDPEKVLPVFVFQNEDAPSPP